ncbi:hypothetical protein P152DRAFT_57145 [Eremomyces bilateralis CBS 781.70]|uniref:Zn(2)-C6 fungal-type domain-containing protein n=1 Tax=Eremomyces bilateralis CBS 781.70 TaxID=1392243 RepID=A0A6G1G0A6_9PEZI|nr:uncharacterized protein P152DRAFT_57145 [Eremomyces bilateralis CBS 781.70]KAF1811473.1 hypothetical protein P152DRAFT_57145 [Eremomyces bilateralis CBS 781.70]
MITLVEATEQTTLPDEKPFYPKRPHRKSRTGCKACKSRKVKCDESRPTCRRCILRNTACVYHGSSPSQQESTSWSSSAASSSPGISDHEILTTLTYEPLFMPSSERDAVDMKLLWFYTTTTYRYCFAIQDGRAKRIDDILKVKIPRHAFEFPFLMDCLLATSALQLQLLNQDIQPSRAVRYRVRALEGYRMAINKARPETFPALIACSLLITNLSSQMFREESTSELHIVDWMVVWRGISLMIDMVSPRRLWELGMAELFLRPSIDLNEAAFHIPSDLLSVISSIKMDDPEYSDIGTYYTTLKYLGSLYSALSEGLSPIVTLRILTWSTFIPEAFVELGRQRQPRALIILAHYLIFMKTIDDLWWVKGIGDREIGGILHYLGDAWSQQLAMPRLALSMDNRLDVARLLLNNENWESPTGYKRDYESRDSPTQTFPLVDNQGKRTTSIPTHPGALYPSVSSSPPPWDTRGYQRDKLTLVASSTHSPSVTLGPINLDGPNDDEV